jgi:hypothetical protein
VGKYLDLVLDSILRALSHWRNDRRNGHDS